MTARNRVVTALNFLTGKRVDYYRDIAMKKILGYLFPNTLRVTEKMKATEVIAKAEMNAPATMKVQNS